MHRGYYTLFPNQYVVLIAESALCSKTTAAGLGMEMVGAAGVEVLKEKLTTAYVYRHLALACKSSKTGDATVSIFAPELSVFLGKDAVLSGLLASLTSLYDCPSTIEYRTKTAGIDIVHNACVNILGAGTFDWMSENLPGDAVECGFTGRVIFVVGEQPRARIAWPMPTIVEMELKDKLIMDLIQISQLKGQIKVTPEAVDLFSDWYVNAKEPEDARLRGFFGRKGDHILKVAMVLSISQSDNLILDAMHVDSAITIIEEVEKLMPLAFRGVAFSKSARHIDRLLQQLRQQGGYMSRSDLLRKNSAHLNKQEFDLVIDTLIDSERIITSTSGIGRKFKTYYSLRTEDKK